MSDQAAADAVLAEKHSIKASEIDIKPALDRETARCKANSERQRKLFAGGLPKNMSDEKLKTYFENFGEI
jgi:RNA recognition motif-containing protein